MSQEAEMPHSVPCNKLTYKQKSQGADPFAEKFAAYDGLLLVVGSSSRP